MLLAWGADVNRSIEVLGTSLWIAAMRGDAVIVKLALQHNAKINIAPKLMYDFPEHKTMKLALKKMTETGEDAEHGQDEDFSSKFGVAPGVASSALLLAASGEQVQGIKYYSTKFAPTELKSMKQDLSLKNLCRKALRKHLVSVSRTNLFEQARLMEGQLPVELRQCMVFDQTIDD